CAKGSEDFDFW
nr:immunoglobulin heavy chain junction region [Macaca mulatta]